MFLSYTGLLELEKLVGSLIEDLILKLIKKYKDAEKLRIFQVVLGAIFFLLSMELYVWGYIIF